MRLLALTLLAFALFGCAKQEQAVESKATAGQAPVGAASPAPPPVVVNEVTVEPEPEEFALGTGKPESPEPRPEPSAPAAQAPGFKSAQDGEGERRAVAEKPADRVPMEPAKRPLVVDAPAQAMDGKKYLERGEQAFAGLRGPGPRGEADVELDAKEDRFFAQDDVAQAKEERTKAKGSDLAKSGELNQPVEARNEEESDKDNDQGSINKPETLRVADAEPEDFLPRMGYFENTYLGGSAAHLERLRRLDQDLTAHPYRLARLADQPFDAPDDGGLALSVTLDRAWLDKPGRVLLQIGLQGSRRFGWRRPPLDVMLVVDRPVLAQSREPLIQAATSLLRRLGPRDRLGVVVVGQRAPLLFDLMGVREARASLARSLDTKADLTVSEHEALTLGLSLAGQRLANGAQQKARIPGTQTILLLGAELEPPTAQAVAGVAHQLAVTGVVTSVIELDGQGAWWPVAAAGNGSCHDGRAGLEGAVEAELDNLSRVIARLLRLNIRLGPKVEAIRILGSRMLEAQEVVEVKAREEATDRHLSASLGLKADRGADDDGLQTVMPYFLGGDAHVVLVELWVKEPGTVVDVTLKYKDMVSLDNATLRASASLGALPRPLTPAQRWVQTNRAGFELAEELLLVVENLNAGGDVQALLRDIEARAQTSADRALLQGFLALSRQTQGPLLTEALSVAVAQRIGSSSATR